MAKKKKNNSPIEKLSAEIEKIQNKNARITFFVFDTKGMPNGELEYIYEMAVTLKNGGYNVRMLHTENEFVGVQNWLGEEYASLPHYNATSDSVDFSPADFLIIPDACCNIVGYTKDLPCKRILLLRNMSYLFEAFPIATTLDDLRIHDAIVATEKMGETLKQLFDSVRIVNIPPMVKNDFYENKKCLKKLFINIISKNGNDVEALVKSFYLKYPAYKWISFRPLRNLPRKEFGEALKDAAITIWMDNDTDFGMSAVEAMACGSILVARVPENEPDWCFKNGEIKDNAVWFYNARNTSDLLASVIQTYLHQNIPSQLTKSMKETADAYNENAIKPIINRTFETYFNDRGKEFEIAMSALKNNLGKESNE